ncbi:MAG: DKNYY domain-containing protein [Ferruginibacter sp.]
MQGQDTLVDVTYFNGYFSQEVDPLTFEPLDGWYAKDKNYVYYYRPVSGGMQISKIDTADSKTFKSALQDIINTQWTKPFSMTNLK